MDKFSDIFKATVAAFHGIIAAWIFVDFSEVNVDQFQFVLLIVCFTATNVIVWNFILLFRAKIRSPDAPAFPLLTGDLSRLSYRAVDVFGLFVVATIISCGGAFIYRSDTITYTAATILGFDRTHRGAPFNVLVSHVSTRQMNRIDGRVPSLVQSAKGDAYLRFYQKDLKIYYEGYPRATPGPLDPREFLLSPACRVAMNDVDPTKPPIVQPIDGPGVYVKASEALTIEVIDRHTSACFKLFPDK